MRERIGVNDQQLNRSDRMYNMRTGMILIFCMMTFLAAGKIFSKESTPRNQGDKTYRQWCCPRCEHWNSAYGPPYVCNNCGKAVPL